MLWLLVIIFAYFLYAITALIDKYLLGGKIPDPKIYSFYVGILGIFSLVFIPFGFLIPSPLEILLSFLAGFIFICALFGYFSTLKLFEASRLIPAIGAMTPLFTFGLIYLFPVEKEILTIEKILAFFILVFGSFLITFEKAKSITLENLQFPIIIAFLTALGLVLTKFVYLTQPFWSGFIWMRIGSFLTALFFLSSKEVRQGLFKNKLTSQKSTANIFILNQILGASGLILQNFAISLAGISYLGIINALQATQYVFLFTFAIFLSLKFPQILKEEISRKILFPKIFAILLIGVGLAILAFFK